MQRRFSQNGHPTRRVLLIEDEETIRETVAIALREEGFEVECLADGQAAWEILHCAESEKQADPKPFPFQLVILDLLLPLIDGLTICQAIRAHQNQVPVLILSAKGNEDDIVLGLDLGADDYLVKPFGLQELIARCRCLLRSYTNCLPPSVLCFGDILLYPEEHRVQVRGQELNLPLLEFRLLYSFLARPQQIQTQAELIKKVWGDQPYIDSKTLAAYIKRLRDKIEANPRSPTYIKTVRGQGYCLGVIEGNNQSIISLR